MLIGASKPRSISNLELIFSSWPSTSAAGEALSSV